MLGIGASGTTHDFFCYNAVGQVWNGTAFVNWADADFADYRVTATAVGASGRFAGTAPAGTFSYELRVRGATLVDSYVVWAERGPRETWTAISDTASVLTIDKV